MPLRRRDEQDDFAELFTFFEIRVRSGAFRERKGAIDNGFEAAG